MRMMVVVERSKEEKERWKREKKGDEIWVVWEDGAPSSTTDRSVQSLTKHPRRLPTHDHSQAPRALSSAGCLFPHSPDTILGLSVNLRTQLLLSTSGIPAIPPLLQARVLVPSTSLSSSPWFSMMHLLFQCICALIASIA